VPPERSPVNGRRPPDTNFYTQVNFLFPATEVELPLPEKYIGFPPEAQKAILVAFRAEQLERHNWLRNQQKNDHELNLKVQSNYFRWRLSGLTSATILALAVLIIGALLVYHGAPIVGVALLVTAIAGLIGTAIYGHQAPAMQGEQSPTPRPEANNPTMPTGTESHPPTPGAAPT
jgi:hypothetical protein